MFTDVKPDNMLFRLNMSANDVEKWLTICSANENGGDSTLRPEFLWNCSPADAKCMHVTLIDLGQGVHIACMLYSSLMVHDSTICGETDHE